MQDKGLSKHPDWVGDGGDGGACRWVVDGGGSTRLSEVELMKNFIQILTSERFKCCTSGPER